ncbi:hypothetical protein [Gimesia aquarii]|uniref:Uncharacterized protein n=1 Tax=Gimesia aquarii TaxID=2527964 RepID=A0A517X090_9PLAN|nr:hypothetical protein [Gimesia aquarii]QDU10901.1 hypothetical protein V202x_43140 [Gimesia aquarii]
MRNTSAHRPLDSYAKTLFEQHSAHSGCGIALRRGDARLRLNEILQAELAVKQQEMINEQITDNIARQQAEHELNMQYLMQFGVRADERQQFQQLLEQVAKQGHLSLREIANRTHVLAQRNGSEDLSASTTVPSEPRE